MNDEESTAIEPRSHAAARVGDLALLRECLANGDDPNLAVDIGNWGWSMTPLMVAAGSREGASAETVAWLLANGADPRRRCGKGTTAAWYAAGGDGWGGTTGDGPRDYVRRLTLLLDAGCDPNDATHHGISLLCLACGAGDPARVKLLLARGVSVKPVSGAADGASASREAMRQMLEDENALKGVLNKLPELNEDQLKALQNKRSQVVEKVLGRALPGRCDSFAIPLFRAAGSASEECVRILLAAGADVHMLDISGATALFSARSAAVAALLLDAGIDPTIENTSGRNAVEELLDNYPDPDIDPGRVAAAAHIREVCRKAGIVLNEQRWLFNAVFSRVPDVVDDLLAAGVSPHFSPHEGSTLLHLACFGDATHTALHCDATRRILRALVAAGVPVNVVNENGQTALHEAVAGDGPDWVATEMLIGFGADLDVQDKSGLTPLIATVSYGLSGYYGPCVKALLHAGANPTIQDAEGLTALDHAREKLEWAREDVTSAASPDEFNLDALRGAEETVQLLEAAMANFVAHLEQRLPPNPPKSEAPPKEKKP